MNPRRRNCDKINPIKYSQRIKFQFGIKLDRFYCKNLDEKMIYLYFTKITNKCTFSFLQMTVPNGTDPQPKKFYKVIILNPSVACAIKVLQFVSYDLNDSVQ